MEDTNNDSMMVVKVTKINTVVISQKRILSLDYLVSKFIQFCLI